MGVRNPEHTRGQLPEAQRRLYDPIMRRLPENQGGNGRHKDPYRAMQVGGLVGAVVVLLGMGAFKAFNSWRKREARHDAEA